jgi:sugar O-acyltransferase (sialic acid O-acetyltransferase NeuD family)
MKNKQLIIVGATVSAKIARFYFDRDTDYEVIAYAVQAAFRKVEYFDGLPVLSLEELPTTYPPEKFDCFVAVGYSKMNSVRERLYKITKSLGYSLPNYISPKCNYLSSEKIGDNNFILEDNTIQPYVKIGSNNVLWSGNHLGHDVKIGDNNFISSHVVISGFTIIGNNCFIGVNSTLRDSIEIADNNLIAAGAIIMNNTEAGDVYLPPRSVKMSKKSSELDF